MSNEVSGSDQEPNLVRLLDGEQYLNTNTDCFLSAFDTRIRGHLTITNFRFFFSSQPLTVDVPLGFILKIDKLYATSTSTPDEIIGLTVICKNGRYYQFTKLENDPNFELLVHDQLVKHTFYLSSSIDCFAFVHKPSLSDSTGWSVYDPDREYTRMGIGDQWRMSNANQNFELCETYPRKLCVPSFVTDEELRLVAQFRSKNRLPVLSWTSESKHFGGILRSSQPLCGMSGKRSLYDEDYLKKIAQMVAAPKGFIYDARPYLNALANCTNGGGYENEKHYDFFKIEFLRIENIHTMRDCLGVVSFNLDSKWLEHLKLILDGCVKICDRVNTGHVVLVHCSDGWDRTPQLTSLSVILMDDYYRTLQGFQVLIEKEWLSFGHKFSTRVGHGCHKYFDQDRSPIFVQFIDCVWQIMSQNKVFFEFNEQLLHDILQSLYSNQYGTFLMDSEKERDKNELKAKTVSLWSYVNSNKEKYTNENYMVYEGDLKIETDKLKLWESYYFKEIDRKLLGDEANRQELDSVGILKSNQSSFNNLFASGLRLLNTMLDKS
ncbi:Myotubularin-related [Brachionus plicatilis]|uniref:Myotubularin-related n=1 Tax=Brachionus plicatilis TaxID=10195 RepID=A0A3M7QVZ5_BRAPC|nr:Myotubularin-related [Brachionus plicatilis]